MDASILISSYNRIDLFRRTLWSIAQRPPSCKFEVIVADESSTEPVLDVLKEFNSQFPWKFITVDPDLFEKQTGLKKYHNNPSVTNNIAFKESQGKYIFLQGNEVIAWDNVYDQLLEDIPSKAYWIVFSTTFDLPADIVKNMDPYGQNLHQQVVEHCYRWPLQCGGYPSDVTNYISLCPRVLWEDINGYDERYYAGISADDSDFVRRARVLGAKTLISKGISLHQFHGGKTKYYNPRPDIIDKQRWDVGVQQNKTIWEDWDGTPMNYQSWPWGVHGVSSIRTNGY